MPSAAIPDVVVVWGCLCMTRWVRPDSSADNSVFIPRAQPAHEPPQRLRQCHAGVHWRNRTVHQQMDPESLGYDFGELCLPLHPALWGAQAGDIVGTHRQDDHVKAGDRGFFQQLDQSWRTQTVDCQYTPFDRVVLAQPTYQLTAQGFSLGGNANARCARIASDEHPANRALPANSAAGACRFRHVLRHPANMPALKPNDRPQQGQQNLALPVTHARRSAARR